mmetsp:Transcript_138682/g.276550  ORF Transcript_138682/g.276550 Transcript_138682/m.276550 type:complete len:81 (+) Transcript_138682:174-416(+)
MRFVDGARGAVTRGYPWSYRNSLPVLASHLPQEGSARWKQRFMPVHKGTQYSSVPEQKLTFCFQLYRHAVLNETYGNRHP